ncbi:hypothetical protein AHAS_Ahas02G0095000 [Arachis hypogaea]
MEVFGGKMGLVSVVVEDNIEEVVHRHMVVEVHYHKETHHIHWIGMHFGVNCVHRGSEDVVAMKVVHKDETSPVIDLSFHNVNHH